MAYRDFRSITSCMETVMDSVNEHFGDNSLSHLGDGKIYRERHEGEAGSGQSVFRLWQRAGSSHETSALPVKGFTPKRTACMCVSSIDFGRPSKVWDTFR